MPSQVVVGGGIDVGGRIFVVGVIGDGIVVVAVVGGRIVVDGGGIVVVGGGIVVVGVAIDGVVVFCNAGIVVDVDGDVESIAANQRFRWFC